MRFTIDDAVRVGEILSQAAQTEIMPRFGRLLGGEVREKSSRFDIVTDADEAAELVMPAALASAYPEAVVIGEEEPHCPRRARYLRPSLCARSARRHEKLRLGAGSVRGDGGGNRAGAGAACRRSRSPCRNTSFALRAVGAWIESEEGTRTDLRVASPVPVGEMDAINGTNFLPEPMRMTVNRNLSRLRMAS